MRTEPHDRLAKIIRVVPRELREALGDLATTSETVGYEGSDADLDSIGGDRPTARDCQVAAMRNVIQALQALARNWITDNDNRNTQERG